MLQTNYHVFFEPPKDFAPTMRAAGCYLVHDQKILILQRHPQKFQGSTWGVPGGKIEKGEPSLAAVTREVFEEVGIDISHQKVKYLGTLYIRLEAIDYSFEIFTAHFDQEPKVDLELSEHVDYGWFLPTEAKELNLIQGGLEALQFYQRKS